MTLTLFSSGTLTADGTEQTIAQSDSSGSVNVTGIFMLDLDLENITTGDTTEIRTYQALSTGDTAVRADFDQFTGIQTNKIYLSLPIPNNNTDTGAVKFTLKQILGTNRTYKWKLWLLDDGANVTKWQGTAQTPATAGIPDVNVKNWNGATVATPATAGYPVVTHKVGTGTGEINLSSGNVPIQSGTGTGQLDFTNGVVKANVVQWLASVVNALISGRVDSNAQVVGDKTGYALTAAYDAAKTAAQAGNQMDLINAPNATAITAIQLGLSKPATAQTIDQTTALPGSPGAGTIGEALKRADAQTGDAYGRIGANGAGLTQTALTSAEHTLISGTDVPAALNTAIPATPTTNSVFDYIKNKLSQFNAGTTSVSLTPSGVQAIWDALTVNLTTPGSIGKRLVDFVTSLVYNAAPTASQNAVAVVDQTLSGHTTAGTVGGQLNAVSTPLNSTQTAQAVLNAVAASYDTAGSIGEQINNAGTSGDPLSNPVPGSYPVGTAGYDIGLLPGINSRTLSPPVNIFSPDTNVTLNITQTVTYSVANGNRKQVNVTVSTDPTGCTVTWTFVNGSAERTYMGVLVSYDSGTGIAVVAMSDFTATKADFPVGAPTILAAQAFSVALALPASAGNLVPIGFHSGKVNVQAAG